jgi:hypothetical protein
MAHASKRWLSRSESIVRVALLHVVLPTFAPVVQGVDVAPAFILQHPNLVISEKGLLEAGKPIESLLAPGSLADFLLLALRAHSMLAVVSCSSVDPGRVK